jgi:FkbM family methyltransferase
MVLYDNTNEVIRWFNDGGDNKFRYDYDLNNDSIVFDVGGYEGNWAKKINTLYEPNLYIFEPVNKYYESISKNFYNNKNVKIYNFGLSNENKKIKINLLEDGSSIFLDSSNSETINLINIVDFINQNGIEIIDLLKLNIEGSEYDVLEHLISKGNIKNIKNIQVQFHNFVENSIERRDKIREILKNTHKETYCYDFVWENWVIK